MDSPVRLQVNPFQIDTWNREEMDIDGPTPPKFVPGPVPRSLAGKDQGAPYSSLLECPVTTRISKVVDSATYVSVNMGALLIWWRGVGRRALHAGRSVLGGISADSRNLGGHLEALAGE